MKVSIAAASLAIAALCVSCSHADQTIVVGSKSFTEAVILGEAGRLLLQDAGLAATHRRGLGGTRLVFNALVSGDIDAYVEYSGTLRNEIFADENPETDEALRQLLAARGIVQGGRLGFENNYALGMPRARSAALGVRRISDLREHPELVLRFSDEFMDRGDGWPGLREIYELPQRNVRGLVHDLAYRAIASGDADVTDLYTTDAEIAYYELALLDDDRGYFPRYDAVLLYRADLERRSPQAVAALRQLVSLIDREQMIAMNMAVKLGGKTETQAAAGFLGERFRERAASNAPQLGTRLLRRTGEHLFLVWLSLAAAVLVAVPLGIVAAHRPRLGQAALALVGIGQTIPALALLVVMVPLFGIGAGPALVALFVYSLLPILRNTVAGINGIAAPLRESAEVLGLSTSTILRRIELPLAMPTLLAGIKTAAVINVGGATLGALVGAGGYGQPILTGIRLDDTALILEGALPAALLALIVQWLFDKAEQWVVAPGLR
ncbi:MAG: glycine betaine ABC transporter substrate-binding protein [Steroidobacteraceae bacterium]